MKTKKLLLPVTIEITHEDRNVIFMFGSDVRIGKKKYSITSNAGRLKMHGEFGSGTIDVNLDPIIVHCAKILDAKLFSPKEKKDGKQKRKNKKR
jgi:hypothetical protein